MLRLGRSVLTQLIASSSASPVSQLHRLLSAVAAPHISPNPSFAVEDYLIGTCGLTRPQALKASPQLSRLKSPSKPDAVRAFLVGLGLSTADIAALVAKDPQFLCAGVDRTLAPIAAGLTGLGLSHTEIARLVSVVPGSFRCKSIVSNLPYYLHLFGSFDNVLLAEILKNTFRWSDAEVRIAVCKLPIILRRSKHNLRSRSEFLISEVGLEPAYIANRPALVSYSLEGRLRPRYYVVKFLMENGLLARDRDYYCAVMVKEKVFMEKFIFPHNEAAPQLAEDYAAACRGEVPTRFRFT